MASQSSGRFRPTAAVRIRLYRAQSHNRLPTSHKGLGDLRKFSAICPIGWMSRSAIKKGSSRIAGKDALDLHEKEFAVPVTVRHSFDDLYSIVYSFQLTSVHWPAYPAHDAPPVAL